MDLFKFKSAYVEDNSNVVNLLSTLPFGNLRREVSLFYVLLKAYRIGGKNRESESLINRVLQGLLFKDARGYLWEYREDDDRPNSRVMLCFEGFIMLGNVINAINKVIINLLYQDKSNNFELRGKKMELVISEIIILFNKFMWVRILWWISSIFLKV